MRTKFFFTMLGLGTLALIDNAAYGQNKKHVKIIEIVDGDTTITEKTIDSKSTSAKKEKDEDQVTFAYSYSSDDSEKSNSTATVKKKTVKKSNKNESTVISIDMDDDKENFKKVIFRNDTENEHVFLLDIETSKDKPFDVEVKDSSGKAVLSKQFKTGKKLEEKIDLSKQKKGSYTITVKQGEETISNHTLTID